MTIDIGRRQFISALGGAIVAWPLPVPAQRADKVPTIGYLASVSEAADRPRRAAFVQRLVELGWVEGRNVRIEYRWADASVERATEIAPEFVRLNVDVIVTSGTEFVAAAKRATSVIPIVFAAAGDPIATGLVASLARPGGNVTGLSLQQTDTAGKRLELLREVVPSLHRLAILANIDSAAAALDMRETETTARALGLEAAMLEIRRAEDIAPTIEALKGHAEALYVVTDPLVSANGIRINTLALGARLPTMHVYRELVEAGGLMSYGPNTTDQFRGAAEIVDKVLRGAEPADIPVEQPTKFDLVINLKTAKALGLTIPGTVLARADDVIE
jgi:putative tryptophan/tyrosine transport system substrate-binding protein